MWLLEAVETSVNVRSLYSQWIGACSVVPNELKLLAIIVRLNSKESWHADTNLKAFWRAGSFNQCSGDSEDDSQLCHVSAC